MSLPSASIEKKKEWQNGMKSFLWNIEVVEKRKEESALNPERLFSLCRLSRNYLQNRLSPENHSRNVFLNKNKRFLK